MNITSKERHELFVSNLKGSHILEVYALIGVSMLFLLLRNCFFLNIYRKFPFWWQCIIESLLVLPFIFICTVCSGYLLLPTAFITVIWSSVFLISAISHQLTSPPLFTTKFKSLSNFLEHEISLCDENHSASFIDEMRALILRATVAGILAVDFKVFPRSYAKTEMFGWSVMDFGVGGFTVMLGIVSGEARGHLAQAPQVLLTRAWKFAYPLIILGVMRTLTVKSSNYQEHVTEYGVHWNFFLTLAVVKLIGTVIQLIIIHCQSRFALMAPGVAAGTIFSPLAAVLWISHRFFDLSSTLESNRRENLFTANIEGILATPGYLLLYLYGVALGGLVYTAIISKKTRLIDHLSFSGQIALLSLCLGLAAFYFQPSSRRIANLPYTLFSMSLSTFILLGCHVFQLFAEVLRVGIYYSSSLLSQVVNRHGFFFFLLANILTGLVNRLMETLDADSWTSVSVLTVYFITVHLLTCLWSRLYNSWTWNTKNKNI